MPYKHVMPLNEKRGKTVQHNNNKQHDASLQKKYWTKTDQFYNEYRNLKLCLLDMMKIQLHM